MADLYAYAHLLAERLRAHPPLLATAVDELLRWWTPVMTFRRTATAEATLAGVQVRARTKVVVSSPSANRDDPPTGTIGHLSPQGTLADPEAVARAVAQPRALPRYREKMPSWLLDGMEVPGPAGRDLARKLSWVAGAGEPGR